MGKIKNGILGAFSGKVGNVIGGTWNGVSYMRAVPVNVKDPKTPKQMAQRQRFSLITSVTRKLKPAIDTGFRTGSGRMSPVNRAVSYNIKNAVSGEYPEQVVDFENLLLSRGDLTGSSGISVSSNPGGVIDITWNDNSGDGSARSGDYLHAACYDTEAKKLYYQPQAATREDAQHTLTLPDLFHGRDVETWIFFVSETETDVSDSEYLGAITVQPEP
jgi:hypothetical protein